MTPKGADVAAAARTSEMSGFIKCPKCKTEIPFNEVIGHEIEEQVGRRLALELDGREHELRAAFSAERASLEQEMTQRAQRKVATEVADLHARISERDALLKDAQERELALREQQRKLGDERAALELDVARRVDDERNKVVAKTREDLTEAHQLEMREKEIELEQMRRQIKDLQESSEQRRSGLRGEALEREIEEVLRERFPHDRIEPIKAGTRGADVLQTVSRRGACCGKILWESKRARNFSNGWVGKLKQDQAAANADFAVLVCSALPPHVRLMEQLDGVWIIEPTCVAALGSVLRETLGLVAQARSIDANRNEAVDATYDYLSSSSFARRIQTAVGISIEMNSDLDLERRAVEKCWSKRNAQIGRLALNIAGMYGELEAVMGSALPTIDLLELPPAVELDVASLAGV